MYVCAINIQYKATMSCFFDIAVPVRSDYGYGAMHWVFVMFKLEDVLRHAPCSLEFLILYSKCSYVPFIPELEDFILSCQLWRWQCLYKLPHAYQLTSLSISLHLTSDAVFVFLSMFIIGWYISSMHLNLKFGSKIQVGTCLYLPSYHGHARDPCRKWGFHLRAYSWSYLDDVQLQENLMPWRD